MKKNRNAKRIPYSCPINFDFSIMRIECKLCQYFDACLQLNSRAMKIAKDILNSGRV